MNVKLKLKHLLGRLGRTAPVAVTNPQYVAVRKDDITILVNYLTAHLHERTCVYCGCSDHNACPGGCAWAAKHPATPTGVCTNCIAAAAKQILTP